MCKSATNLGKRQMSRGPILAFQGPEVLGPQSLTH